MLVAAERVAVYMEWHTRLPNCMHREYSLESMAFARMRYAMGSKTYLCAFQKLIAYDGCLFHRKASLSGQFVPKN